MGQYDPIKLTDKHREWLKRIAAGDSIVRVASQFGVHPVSVTRLKTSEKGKRYLQKLRNMRNEAYLQSAIRKFKKLDREC